LIESIASIGLALSRMTSGRTLSSASLVCRLIWFHRQDIGRLVDGALARGFHFEPHACGFGAQLFGLGLALGFQLFASARLVAASFSASAWTLTAIASRSACLAASISSIFF
jgi:hypothetical protein